MRLSEEIIKQAILHPQLEIRQRTVRYFSVCHSDDELVVPLVIQAVERYGREDAYHLVGGSVDLRFLLFRGALSIPANRLNSY